ncbi:MAG: hypothetical protein K1W36_16900 [Lachnospiraceae bacterium]
MEKEVYITDEEREKCGKVADAYAEFYEPEDIFVADAGRYGFVKLLHYTDESFNSLPMIIQKEIGDKHSYFAEMAGLNNDEKIN